MYLWLIFNLYLCTCVWDIRVYFWFIYGFCSDFFMWLTWRSINRFDRHSKQTRQIDENLHETKTKPIWLFFLTTICNDSVFLFCFWATIQLSAVLFFRYNNFNGLIFWLCQFRKYIFSLYWLIGYWKTGLYTIWKWIEVNSICWFLNEIEMPSKNADSTCLIFRFRLTDVQFGTVHNHFINYFQGHKKIANRLNYLMFHMSSNALHDI